MPRPSRNTDKRLLLAGRKLLPDTGISGLSLRRVAAEAGVNPGMFHYHFKTKEAFVRLVLQDIYEEFFRGFRVEAGGEAPPLERLRRALVTVARFARDNRALFLTIIHDVLEGDPQAIRFAQDNVPRHLAIIGGLVEDCQRRGLLERMPLPAAMAFLLGAIGMPNIALGVAERASARRPFGVAPGRAEDLLASDAAISLRTDLALKALAREAA